MPRFNGTGPFGAGPRTGRGLGTCGGGMGSGRGMGYGRGMGSGAGIGSGRNFYTKGEESEMLKEEEKELENELKAIKERMSELK